MNKLTLALKSKTVWLIVVLFLSEGLKGISPELTGTPYTVAQACLAILAILAKLYPSQDYEGR